MSDLDALVEAIGRDVIAHTRPSYALFGHSLGGMIAWELAAAVRNQDTMKHLFLSAVRPPFRPSGTAMHQLPDGELLVALRELDGTPPEDS